MPNFDAIEKIKKLTDQEREVFKLFCKDLIYRDIGKKLYIKESTVKKHMSNIRMKLEVDKMNRRKRDSVLRNKFCMALQTFENHEQEKDIKGGLQSGTKSKGSNDKKTTEVKIIENNAHDEQNKEKEKPKKDVFEEVEKKDDEKPLDQEKKPPDEQKEGSQMKKTSNTKNNRFRSLKTIWRLISIAAIILSGYMIYDHFFGTNAAQPASSPEESGVEQSDKVVVDTTQEEPADLIQATAIPTKIEVIPTNTEVIPTETFTPEPTSPPKPAILFEDDFENGLSDAWEVVSGNPMVVNGMLTTDRDTWLLVGDPSWKNYSVEFVTDSPFGWHKQEMNAVGVRAQGIENMYAYGWGSYIGAGYIEENGEFTEVPNTKMDFEYDYDIKTQRITVQDGVVTVYRFGSKIISFVDERFTSGRVAIKITNESTIDDFKIKEILE